MLIINTGIPNDTLNILLSFVILFVMVFLVYLAADRYFKERKRFREEQEILMDGILSRSAMMNIVATCIAKLGKEETFTMLYIDLDRFSEYNTAFGYKEADKLLERIAMNIKDVVPRGVKVGRDHADQFYVYIGNEWNRNKALEVAQLIKRTIEKPIKLFGDTEVKVTSSIGICFFPMHGDNFRELTESLKIAVYIIKKNGGNGMRIYSEEMDKQEGQYVDYYYQIKNAIMKKEFQLYYHPIVDVEKKELYGFEALIRWNHPEFGVLAPYKFLNIMEQSGDIHWIGFWGLETIVKAFLEAKQEFPDIPLRFSLNLSPKQLMNDQLAQDFQKLLRKYKLTANHFILEIIEFALFEKQENIYQNIKRLSELGFQIAIDGFGLEYSMLTKLEKYDIDIIKLDNEFLLEEEAYLKARFAQLLVEFAQKNNYKVICEAIENEKMLKEAQTYKIDLMQGYYFSKPMSFEDLKAYVNEKLWQQ